MTILNWVVTNLLNETAIFMALIAAAGLIVQKKSVQEIIEGSVLTAVGYYIFNAASDIIIPSIISLNALLLPMLPQSAGISASSDFIVTFAYTVEYVAQHIMPVFILSWLVHILVVKFLNRWFKAVYLTVHVQIGWTGMFMLFFYYNMGMTGLPLYLVTILLNTIVWSVGPMLTYKDAMEMSGDAFAMGHYVCISGWICTKLAPFLGNPEKDDADNLQLPGWLNMFANATLSQALAMPVIFIIVCLLVLIVGNVESLAALADKTGNIHWIIWCLLRGFGFAAGNAVLLQGLRMFLGAIIPAFQGFSEKILPGAVPAVDFVAFFGYAPIAVMLGFIGFATGGFISAIVAGVTGFGYAMAIPNVALSFFNGGALGVFSNKRGGWKAAIILPLIFGFVMHFFAGYAAGYFQEMAAVGYGVGSVDPVIIASLLGLIFGKR